MMKRESASTPVIVREVANLKKAVDPSALTGKSVLITGGASGIGALIATTLCEHGARVTIADINEQQGKTFVQELKLNGLSANLIATDVTQWTSQVQAFKSAIAFSGSNSVDIVVAAAGLPGADFISQKDESPTLDCDPPEPRLAGPTFDVNIKGVYFTSKLAQHYFALPSTSSNTTKKTPRKSLVVISSLAGYLELNDADYTASKWAVRGIFRSIRSMMEDRGYRVNLIAPWVMDTPMSKSLADTCRQHGIPVGEAQSVADAVVQCAADDSICGQMAQPSIPDMYADADS